jgi:hypothetical protein
VERWITFIGGLMMVAMALAGPQIRQAFGGQPWEAVFTTEKLRRYAQLQERAAQVALAGMGAGFAVSGGGSVLGLPELVVWILATICFALAVVALATQVAIVVRSRREE